MNVRGKTANERLRTHRIRLRSLKGLSLVNKPSETNSVVKYNSFIHSCKLSPSKAKSSERVVKRSQRKLDMNFKQKSSCSKRKNSSSSKSGTSKVPSTTTSNCKHKVSYKQLTRNPSKAEGFDCNYSALMDTYTDLMAKKRQEANKIQKKEYSQSFHMEQKKSMMNKKSFLESKTKNTNRYVDKENIRSENKPSTTKHYPESTKKTLANRFYFRRHTETTKKKPAEVKKKTDKTPYHEISNLIESFKPINSSCKNLKQSKYLIYSLFFS